MRWFVRDAIRVEGRRIIGAAVLEVLGYACKFLALAGVVLFVRRLQGSGAIHAFGRDWPLDGVVVALVAAVSVTSLFVVGAVLMYASRSIAIVAVEGCSRHWLGLARDAARCNRPGLDPRDLNRWAVLAGQDALGAGRVVWQLARSGASVLVGAVLLVGMVLVEPMLTILVGMLAVPGLWWQYRAGMRGAQSTRRLETAAAAVRQAWTRESATGPDGSVAGADRDFNRLLRVRSDQLRVGEEGGLSASIAMAVLLGVAIVYFGVGRSQVAGQLDLVIAYAVALRALVGIIDGSARRLVAVHRLYPHLARFVDTVIVGAPAGVPAHEHVPDSIDADAAAMD